MGQVAGKKVAKNKWRRVKANMAKIKVLDREVTLFTQKDEDYICITDIARYKDAERSDYIIQNWLRNRDGKEGRC
jgi:hypothetical protein